MNPPLVFCDSAQREGFSFLFAAVLVYTATSQTFQTAHSHCQTHKKKPNNRSEDVLLWGYGFPDDPTSYILHPLWTNGQVPPGYDECFSISPMLSYRVGLMQCRTKKLLRLILPDQTRTKQTSDHWCCISWNPSRESASLGMKDFATNYPCSCFLSTRWACETDQISNRDVAPL